MLELDFSSVTPKQPQLVFACWKGATIRLGCLYLDPRGQENFNQLSLTVLRNTGEIDLSDS